MTIDEISELMFEYFESNPSLKEQFYDAVLFATLEGNKTKLGNLLNLYEEEIVKFNKICHLYRLLKIKKLSSAPFVTTQLKILKIK